MRRLAALLLLIGCPFLLRAQPVLYVTSGNGNQSYLYTVNPTNAQSTLVGQVKVGLQGVVITGMAFHPTTGVLYGVTGSEYSPSRQLVTINLATAAATSLGTIGLSSNQNASDITFAADGSLFGWTTRGGPLVSIDPTNATRTVIGSAMNGTQSNGLTFVPNGTLYMAGPNLPGDLYTVNTSTGAITSAATFTNVPSDLGAINAMASDPSGVLYAVGRGSGHQLVTINPITGAMTVVGVLAFESDALAFQAVPEPSTYALLLGIACVGLVAIRRRK
jgi:hypothetical protein